jgi:hypothetical protein
MEVLRAFLREAHKVFDALTEDEQTLYLGHMQNIGAELVPPWDDEFAQSAEYPGWNTERAKAYMNSVNAVAPAFKAWAFREEKEWRVVSPLIFGGPESEEYRAGSYCPIPYTKFKLPKFDERLQVKKIIVGPTENPDLSFMTVRRMCQRYSVHVEGFGLSEVPFRHWDAK